MGKLNFLKRKSDKAEIGQNLMPKKPKWKKFIKIFAVIIVCVIILNAIFGPKKGNVQTNGNVGVQTAKVETRDIRSVLTSSGAIEPLNKYEVKTLVQGEVVSADFEVGDEVKKGDILYQITTDDLESKIDTSQTTVKRAEENYENAKKDYQKSVERYNKALADYQDAASEYGDLTIKSNMAGIVKKLYVKKGDRIQAGAQIADIYDNSYMLLDVPFSASDVTSSLVGKKAKIEMVDNSEVIEGKVYKVSNIEEVLSGNRVVKKVTIKVKNPGGITTESTATATIGKMDSSGEGTFRVLEEGTLIADKSGKITSLNIEEGDRVKDGSTVIVLDSNTYKDQLKSYETAVDSAKDAMEAAQRNMDDAQNKIEDSKASLKEVVKEKADYSIEAPISGTVVRKAVLEGDTISAQANPTLCVIYDLSSVTFKMQIDELDIMKVHEGQKVTVTADALEGVTYTGIVTNISLESTTQNGVTQYPVTVKIDEYGDLLPGMNVTGEILLDEVKNVMAIPSDALMRGDVVYVSDPSVTEAQGDIPAGFREVSVETGLTDGSYIEIKSGLKGDEEVYVVQNTSMEDLYMMEEGEVEVYE